MCRGNRRRNTVSSQSHADAHVAHHFESAEQQRQSAQFGMWVFLVSEMMFFGGLFTAYIIYRMLYPAAWAVGSSLLDLRLGGVNTLIIFGSSFALTMAIHCAQTDKRKSSATWIVLTLALGVIFLGVKGLEYAAKFEHHLVPGAAFHFDPASHLAQLQASGVAVSDHLRTAFETATPHHVQLFFSMYFAMTGVHAVHMIIGIGLLLWLLKGTAKGRYSSAYYNPVEVCGMYWHFVDLIWIFLFPLLYLVGR